jgi:N-acetylmuramoyl-L-alanine amidase
VKKQIDSGVSSQPELVYGCLICFKEIFRELCLNLLKSVHVIVCTMGKTLALLMQWEGMKMARWLLVLLSVLSLSTGLKGHAATASQFEQREVDQSRYIAIANPSGVNAEGETAYQLLILGQMDDSRACWGEIGSNPVAVDMFLLEFDFTNICSRSTDSNGYSVRLAGQDWGLEYSLRIVRQNNDLVLIAINNREFRGPRIEVGRTYGIPEGPAKIILNPGWRLTQRTFEGNPLGHIYVTHDEALPVLIAAVQAPNATDQQPEAIAPANPQVSYPETSTSVIPEGIEGVPVDGGAPVEAAPTSVDSASAPAIEAEMPSISIPTSDPAPAIATEPTPAPTPLPEVAPSIELEREVEFSQTPASPVNPSDSSVPAPVEDLLTPTNSIPQQPNTLPPPPPDIATVLGFNYRVVVYTDTPEQQDQVRALVPDAFLIALHGRPAMQAGLFAELSDAEQLQQRLTSQNLPAEVVPVNPQ